MFPSFFIFWFSTWSLNVIKRKIDSKVKYNFMILAARALDWDRAKEVFFSFVAN